MTKKPFLTINQQLDLLKNRGLIIDGDSKHILETEGYYSVVNGYKAPFLDMDESKRHNEDRYKQGTSFNDVYLLFLMDRSLRELTFHYTTKVEAMLKTTCSYCFAEAHQEPNAYLKDENFSTEEQYLEFGLKTYIDDKQKLQSLLYDKKNNSSREPIIHYRNKYNEVPIWILATDLTFGNIEHLYNLMQPNDRKAVCKMVSSITSGDKKHQYIDPINMRKWINTIVKVRNMCAHDERLYCAHIGNRKNINFAGFLLHISHLLTEKDYEDMIDAIVDLVESFSGRSNIISHILDNMGLIPAE